MSHALFGQHPYGMTTPTEESISSTTAVELRREYARRFRPDQAILVVVGDFDPGKNGSDNGHAAGQVDRARNSARAAGGEAHVCAAAHGLRGGSPDSVQTTLAFGSLAATEGSPDYAATVVANAMFGGMFGSRLTKNIREDKGYTYTPYSYVSPRRTVGVRAR